MRIDQKIIGVIPARGGSKGVPRKNIRELGGKPLLAWTIEAGLACPLLTDLVVSTDDSEIQKIALKYGAQAPFLRPAELATDTALAVPTIQHSVREMEKRKNCLYDIVIMLQPTTPFRLADDITQALENMDKIGAEGVISVVKVNNAHPLKMKRYEHGLLLDYSFWPVENPPRQSLPEVFIVNGAIYATKRDVFMNKNSFKGSKCAGYIMPDIRSVNIDGEIDFLLAELLVNKGLISEKKLDCCYSC